MNVPDWLKVRAGNLVGGLDDRTIHLTLDGHLQYRLVAAPAKGKFTCAVTQANNARRLDDGKEYADRDSALAGGLEELRAKLGW